DPLLVQPEAPGAGHNTNLLWPELVATFRPDGLAVPEIYRQFCLGNAHRLLPAGPQMHLDALVLPAIADHVLEPAEVEIGVQFAINPAQQVEVEGCIHT